MSLHDGASQKFGLFKSFNEANVINKQARIL